VGPSVLHIICDLNHMRAFRPKIGFLRMVSGIADNKKRFLCVEALTDVEMIRAEQ